MEKIEAVIAVNLTPKFSFGKINL